MNKTKSDLPESIRIKVQHIAAGHRGLVTVCRECKDAFWRADTKERAKKAKAAK